MTMRLRITAQAAGVRVDRQRRTIFGTLFRYGEVGHTDGGALRIDTPGAIELPDDFTTVELTREHDPRTVRGHLAMYDDNGERVYVAVRVADGPAGDDALAEAESRERAGLSWDIEEADIRPVPDDGVDGVIVSAKLRRIGQVRDPAYNSARIDRVVASKTSGPTGENNQEGTTMTEEQIARLAELRAKSGLTPEEQAELEELAALEAAQPEAAAAAEAAPAAAAAPAATATAARVPTVPGGVPRRTDASAQSGGSQPGALARFYAGVTAALDAKRNGANVTAAFSDVTSTANPSVEAPAWSGELWSGLQYDPEWTVLFNTGELTSWEGSGWRWVTKPAMADYAGDKTAVPSGAVTTEPSSYEAARMACGHDLDRKFYDFPNQAFIESYAQAAREDWAVKLDAKVRAYAIANAVAYGAVQDSLLKAAALAAFGVKANTRSRATFIAVNDADFLNLLDVSQDTVPAFLSMFNIDPSAFVYTPDIAAGTVMAGVKQAATVRTLPGSPIRVDAQHLANGGVDTAFFGYWAIEEHHETGIVKTTFA